MDEDLAVVVTARNEADRLAATIAALKGAFPRARVIVADDGSEDATAHVALDAGAELVRAGRRIGKGGAATLGARHTLPGEGGPPLLLLCDGDLGDSAAALEKLVAAVREGRADMAVAAFERRTGGGFGIALGYAARVIRRLTGLEPAAPISGQRAIAPRALAMLLPFAPGFGMEIGMTVDAHRAGLRIREIELPLQHRATGRTPAGFLHRARQLRDFRRVYRSRR